MSRKTKRTLGKRCKCANTMMGRDNLPPDPERKNERRAAVVESELKRMEIFEAGGVERAIQAASNYRVLRRRGKTVRKTIDVLIATFCLQEQHSLLHRDRDFDPFVAHLGLQSAMAQG